MASYRKLKKSAKKAGKFEALAAALAAPAVGAAAPATTQTLSMPLGIPGVNLSTVQRTVPADEPPVLPLNKDLAVLGKRTQRLDARLKVTGQARYTRSEDRTVPNNEMATLSAGPFSPIEANRYAGALGDPARMAANFAGVSSSNDSRNDIIVRGNSPASLLWRLEGVNIPNPNHFGSQGTTGGPVSLLNNNLLAKSDFLTGAFPAEYANALGSVFDLRLRKGNDEKREFLGQVGFNGVEVGAEGPYSKKSKASYLINYRYSVF